MSEPFAERRADLERCLAEAVPAGQIERDVPMSRHTSFRIGGPADFLVTVLDRPQLVATIRCCRRSGVPFLILGRGTNLLVRDGGIRGVVIKPGGEFLHVTYSGETVEAGAAAGLADVARECGRRGLTGLEFAVGIPGTIGGAVVMNAGAYGAEMKDVVESAVCLLPEADHTIVVPAADLGFGYRTSRPGREGWVVVSARLRLAAGDQAAIRAAEDDYTARRRSKQPLDLPSAGSVFKRPPGHYAGTLIQKSGCKGLRIGDAQVSELHANFIVNLGSATARDVLDLIDLVRRKVHAHAGVWLEPELKVVGEDPPAGDENSA